MASPKNCSLRLSSVWLLIFALTASAVFPAGFTGVPLEKAERFVVRQVLGENGQSPEDPIQRLLAEALAEILIEKEEKRPLPEFFRRKLESLSIETVEGTGRSGYREFLMLEVADENDGIPELILARKHALDPDTMEIAFELVPTEKGSDKRFLMRGYRLLHSGGEAVFDWFNETLKIDLEYPEYVKNQLTREIVWQLTRPFAYRFVRFQQTEALVRTIENRTLTETPVFSADITMEAEPVSLHFAEGCEYSLKCFSVDNARYEYSLFQDGKALLTSSREQAALICLSRGLNSLNQDQFRTLRSLRANPQLESPFPEQPVMTNSGAANFAFAYGNYLEKKPADKGLVWCTKDGSTAFVPAAASRNHGWSVESAYGAFPANDSDEKVSLSFLSFGLGWLYGGLVFPDDLVTVRFGYAPHSLEGKIDDKTFEIDSAAPYVALGTFYYPSSFALGIDWLWGGGLVVSRYVGGVVKLEDLDLTYEPPDYSRALFSLVSDPHSSEGWLFKLEAGLANSGNTIRQSGLQLGLGYVFD